MGTRMNGVLDEYVKKTNRGNELDINEQEWSRLNSLYSREMLIDAISDCILGNSIILPTRDLTLSDADNSHKDLVALDTDDLICNETWFSRYEYQFDKTDMLFKCSKVGNVASDYFHQSNRFKCDSINSPSPYRSWHTDSFRKTLLNALWTMKYKRVNTDVFRSIIGLRKYIASQFRPSTTKAVLDFFDAKSVLDFSMGWGDRLQGFMSSHADYYFGLDPNTALHDGYNQQIERYNSGKTIQFFCRCAEDIDAYDLCQDVDLVFTSPPYFNIERYSKDESQSYKKYKGIDNWLEGFLFKSISHAWSKLKPLGHLVINISDVYSGHRVNKICDPMNQHIQTLKGSVYVGCYGYEMMKRPNSGAIRGKDGHFAEPMWVWKKMF